MKTLMIQLPNKLYCYYFKYTFGGWDYSLGEDKNQFNFERSFDYNHFSFSEEVRGEYGDMFI